MGTTRPLVSVVVPAFNAARFLAPTLRSIARQTWRPLEAVLWDDGSSDGTARIFARFAAILEARGIACTLGRHEGGANLGTSATRNAAIAVARGELVQLLDDDDLLPARKIELHARALAEAPGVDAVTCDGYSFRRFRGAPWLVPWWSREAPDVSIELWAATPFPPSAPLFRRRVFDLAGGFDASTREVMEDHDFWFKAVRAGARFRRATQGGAVRVHFRRHGANRSNDLAFVHRADGVVRRRIAELAREAGRGWELLCAASGVAEQAGRLAWSGLTEEAALCTAVAPILERLERFPPADWRPGWEKTWLLLLQHLFRAPGLEGEVLRRFARWAVHEPGAKTFASPRARTALAALEAFDAAPGARWPRVLLRRAGFFRTLGILGAIRAGAPLGLALGLARAGAEDALSAAWRVRALVA